MTLAKSTWLRHALVALCGGVLGVCLATVYLAMAATPITDIPVPLQIIQEVTSLAALGERINEAHFWILLCVSLSSIALWLLVVGQLDPALAGWRYWRLAHPWRCALRVLASGALVMIFTTRFLYVSLAGDGTQPVLSAAISAFMVFGLAWIIITPRRSDQNQHHGHMKRWRTLLPVFCWGGAYGILLVVMCVLAFGFGYHSYISVVAEALDRSGDISSFVLQRLVIALTLTVAVLSLVAYSVLPAFRILDGGWRYRLESSRSAVIVMAAIAGLLTISVPMVPAFFDLNKASLIEAAQLDKLSPDKLVLVQFCGDLLCEDNAATTPKSPLKIQPWPSQLRVISQFTSADVMLSEQAVPLLQDFIMNRAQSSVYRKRALLALAAIYERLWLPYQEFHVYDELERQGELPYGRALAHIWRQVRWLEQSAPVNYLTVEDLDLLSDPKLFAIQGRVAARLSEVWRRFGDAHRAEQLMTVARNTGYQAAQSAAHSGAEDFSVRNGTIVGRLRIGSGTPAGIRIALFHVSEREVRENTVAAATLTDSTNVVDSILLSDDGDFSFTNLTGGYYHLAMLAPAELLSGVNDKITDKIPGMIVLDGEQPDVDLDIISIGQKE